MGSYETIKGLIDQNITTNAQGLITGSVLNATLKSIVDTLGVGSRFCGSINTSSSITAPDGNVFYFATQGGTYANCGNVTVQDGLAIIKWENGAWGALQLLWYDSVPTPNSSHLVLSGGIYTAMQEIASSITVTGNDKGVYTSEANLLSAYSSPEVGWKALVGDSSPLALYICETRGTWEDSGMSVDLEYGELISDVKVNGVSVVNAAKVANITIPEVTVDGETLIF